MKIKISKSQWEKIGKVAGWNKTAQDLGEMGEEQQPRLNPDFDAKKVIKNDIDAAMFLFDVISYMPARLPMFLGMKENELHNTIKSHLGLAITPLLKNAPPEIKDRLQDLKFDTYPNAIATLKKLFGMFAGGDPRLLPGFLLPVLGFTKEMEAVKRIHNYAPFVIKGTEETERAVNDDKKADKQNAINSILDRYNAGKIDKQKMETMMQEFAGYKIETVKMASGIEYKWIKI